MSVLVIFLVICIAAVGFLLCFLIALCRDKDWAIGCVAELEGGSVIDSPTGEREQKIKDPVTRKRQRSKLAAGIVLCACSVSLRAQSPDQGKDVATVESTQAMQERINRLEAEVSELKSAVKHLQMSPAFPTAARPDSAGETQPVASQQNFWQSDDRKSLDFLLGTTVNLGLDGYYAFNFSHPIGRVNLLRAYDVLSNEFSLNQATVIVDHPPDVAAGRRWGGRLDLQFGQATDTLQGNPANEPRPQIYRNIFQAYGSVVVPVGRGVNLDFGKWGSSLGIEGNYTKDQMNYSRSFWFDFLPFYHMGLRTSVPVNDRLTVNYWVVNGTNQVEDTNGFKDELFGFTAKPNKSTTWTVNYYLGQDHPDRVMVQTPANPVPVQPGLTFQGIRPAPDGRTHIVDSYATWQATSKLSLALEGDYLIQRLWRNAGPGRSSAPSVTDGACAYVRYQWTPKLALASRSEIMSDGGGLFSGISQTLKESTVTFDYKMSNGVLMRYEWRRDFSNQPSFLSDVQGVLSKEQNTATIGLVWWWGQKEGAW